MSGQLMDHSHRFLLKFIDINEEKALEIFKVTAPDTLTNEELKILISPSEVNLETYLGIYEKLYSYALNDVKNYIVNIDSKLKRKNINGVIVEYIINPTSNKAIILLEGLPTVPSKKDILLNLFDLGYSVFFPRYKGTWESEGKFLENSPTEEINSLINSLHTGISFESEIFKFSEIILLASSFGGAVALAINNKFVSKSICLSPVYDFKEVVGIETLEKYLKDQYPSVYRFSNSNWKRLLSNKILKPNIDNPDKIIVFGGSNDSQILAGSLAKFCKENRLKLNIMKGAEHLSISKIKSSLWGRIVSVLA